MFRANACVYIRGAAAGGGAYEATGRRPHLTCVRKQCWPPLLLCNLRSTDKAQQTHPGRVGRVDGRALPGRLPQAAKREQQMLWGPFCSGTMTGLRGHTRQHSRVDVNMLKLKLKVPTGASALRATETQPGHFADCYLNRRCSFCVRACVCVSFTCAAQPQWSSPPPTNLFCATDGSKSGGIFRDRPAVKMFRRINTTEAPDTSLINTLLFSTHT